MFSNTYSYHAEIFFAKHSEEPKSYENTAYQAVHEQAVYERNACTSELKSTSTRIISQSMGLTVESFHHDMDDLNTLGGDLPGLGLSLSWLEKNVHAPAQDINEYFARADIQEKVALVQNNETAHSFCHGSDFAHEGASIVPKTQTRGLSSYLREQFSRSSSSSKTDGDQAASGTSTPATASGASTPARPMKFMFSPQSSVRSDVSSRSSGS